MGFMQRVKLGICDLPLGNFFKNINIYHMSWQSEKKNIWAPILRPPCLALDFTCF